MNQEIKQIAVSQYVKSFMWLFIIVAILCVGAIVTFIKGSIGGSESTIVRMNTSAPTERVFDYADIFTDEEEQALRNEIAEVEAQIGCDIVIVSISQMVEGSEAAMQYGYRYNDWSYNMRDLADDFYDNNNYGYNKVHGDGVLFLTNDLGAQDGNPSQKGTWLSTCGKAETRMSSDDIDDVLYKIDDILIANPSSNYAAHMAGIKAFKNKMQSGGKEEIGNNIYLAAIFVPILISIVFFFANFKSKEGNVTVTANTYVEKNGMNIVRQQDQFVNKVVTKRHIESSSGSGGGGGHHTSSGGVSHGGGGHRR